MNGNTLLRAAKVALAAAALAVAAPLFAQQHDATVGISRRHIYPEIGQAQADIQAALVEARKTHKRIILDFGGDWCGDCQVLYLYFHQAPNQEIVDKHFVIVPVNIGRMDANLDIARKYGVPVKGVPALAVLDSRGKVLVAQNLEFADMRHMEPQSVTEFLNKWKQ